MSEIILSICIPVYNRFQIFRHALISACEASLNYKNEVEIVVSDNASEDDIYSIFADIKSAYSDLKLIYHKNQANLGIRNNILQVVNLSRGNYCWIIGSDDFIKVDGVKNVLNILNENPDTLFFCTNYDLINLKDLNLNSVQNFIVQDQLTQEKLIIKHEAPIWSMKFEKFDSLIDPLFNNVFLGAIMVGIFNRNTWLMFNQKQSNFDSFNSLMTIYPHCYTYAHTFIGKKAYYYGVPTITVGEGAREWSTETGNSYWESSLPLINFKILGDLIKTYKLNGLSSEQYKKCKKQLAFKTGAIYLPFFYRLFIKRLRIKDISKSDFFSVFIYYIFSISFYRGIYKSIFKNKKV